MLLQPTSPLRETKHIDEAVKMYFDSGFENLVSVKPLEDGLELIYSREGDGSLKKFLQDDNHSARRQDFKKYYVLNGAIYLTNVKRYLTNGGFYSGRTLSYVMDTESSVDIDNMLDLELARLIYKKRKELR